MTERKPPGITFSSWIDQQISAAAERGAFDDLPGAGKPLPKQRDFDGQTWLREYVRREGGSPEDCLPTPLRLRKEIERLGEKVSGLRHEQQVRDVVGELNERIMQWRRLPIGLPIFVPLADAEATVAAWREARQAAARQASPGDDRPGQKATTGPPPTSGRWRIRRRAATSGRGARPR